MLCSSGMRMFLERKCDQCRLPQITNRQNIELFSLMWHRDARMLFSGLLYPKNNSHLLNYPCVCVDTGSSPLTCSLLEYVGFKMSAAGFLICLRCSSCIQASPYLRLYLLLSGFLASHMTRRCMFVNRPHVVSMVKISFEMFLVSIQMFSYHILI